MNIEELEEDLSWLEHSVTAFTAMRDDSKKRIIKATREYLDALKQEPFWRTIETPPEDKVDVLVYCSDTNEQFVARKLGEGGLYRFFQDESGVNFCCIPTHWIPTHWMPLPSVPEVQP